MSTRIDCLGWPAWGVQLDGSVANASGTTISSASLWYRQNGGPAPVSKTISLSSRVSQDGPGYWSGLTIRTWAPDYRGEPFYEGSSVSWTVTVNLANGSSAQKSGTTSQNCY